MFTTDNAQQIIKSLISRFESGDIAPVIEIATLKLSKAASIPATRSRSICNQVLAIMQTGEIDCRGFRQWEDVKRHVMKGAHAAYILGPIQIKDKTDGKEEIKLVGFKCIPVFPASMTDGEPIPEAESLQPASLPPLFEVAQAWNLKVDYMPFSGTAYGSYSTREKLSAWPRMRKKYFFTNSPTPHTPSLKSSKADKIHAGNNRRVYRLRIDAGLWPA